jgi:hypothetical protein
LQFIIYQSSYHSAVHSRDFESIVK